VLDDVERRRFLVEPAREDALEPALGPTHVELDEGAGEPLHLPGRGRLAGAQPHDRVAIADRLAGPEAEFAHLAVALVEQAHHRDPLGHRRRAGREPFHRLGDVDRIRFDAVFGLPILLLGSARAAGGGEGQARQHGDRPPSAHDQSGVQA